MTSSFSPSETDLFSTPSLSYCLIHKVFPPPTLFIFKAFAPSTDASSFSLSEVSFWIMPPMSSLIPAASFFTLLQGTSPLSRRRMFPLFSAGPFSFGAIEELILFFRPTFFPFNPFPTAPQEPRRTTLSSEGSLSLARTDKSLHEILFPGLPPPSNGSLPLSHCRLKLDSCRIFLFLLTTLPGLTSTTPRRRPEVSSSFSAFSPLFIG